MFNPQGDKATDTPSLTNPSIFQQTAEYRMRRQSEDAKRRAGPAEQGRGPALQHPRGLRAGIRHIHLESREEVEGRGRGPEARRSDTRGQRSELRARQSRESPGNSAGLDAP